MPTVANLDVPAYWERWLQATTGALPPRLREPGPRARLSRSTPLQVNIGAQQVNVAGDL